ncbi:MAG: DUF1800 domain-containing protein, partial [Planctomycetia bacterium]
MHFLAPYRPASFSHRDAAHLLTRAQFGASPAEIDAAVDAGLPATLERLLNPDAAPAPTSSFAEIDALLRESALAAGALDRLKAWALHRMLYSPTPLVEKMTLFWHNHFATSTAKVNSVPHMAAQNDLLRKHALGRFGDLLHGMARDTAMLVWLDGRANRKRAPNENFAREVMELFSLGVGNYTETDIKEAARAFTGWQLRYEQFYFDASQHDPGPKTLFGKTGAFQGNDVVDLCLAQPACPRYLAAKLCRFFVAEKPAPELTAAVAASLRRHDLAVAPVLRELLGSESFFAPAARHAVLKSPLDY